jgi:uncharacterized protein YjbI with pentapeptide repeats
MNAEGKALSSEAGTPRIEHMAGFGIRRFDNESPFHEHPGNWEVKRMALNEELVATGLRVTRDCLSAYLCQEIEKAFGESWWTTGVLEALVFEKTPTVEDVIKFRRLPLEGTPELFANSMDINTCLILFTKHWHRISRETFDPSARGWAYELMGVRNENKHLRGADHRPDFAWRALDTMYRLCSQFDELGSKALVALRSEIDLSEYRTEGPPANAHAEGSPAFDLEPGGGRNTAAAFAEHIGGSSDETLEEELLVAGPDFSGADLRKMSLAGASLAGADFTDADLTDANLEGANLQGAIFRNTSLGNADLSNADLRNAHFEASNLSVTRNEGTKSFPDYATRGAKLTGATLDGATLNFSGSDLRNARMKGTNLAGADFTNADLTDANLEGANLQGAIFRNTSLGNADLSNADLRNAHFEASNLSVTRNEGTKSFPDYATRGAKLTGATLDGATLNFSGSDLRNARMKGTNLAGADFTNADLTDANLEGANLQGATLKGAKVKEARIDGAIWG